MMDRQLPREFHLPRKFEVVPRKFQWPASDHAKVTGVVPTEKRVYVFGSDWYVAIGRRGKFA